MVRESPGQPQMKSLTIHTQGSLLGLSQETGPFFHLLFPLCHTRRLSCSIGPNFHSPAKKFASWNRLPNNIRHELLILSLPFPPALEDHSVQSWLHYVRSRVSLGGVLHNSSSCSSLLSWIHNNIRLVSNISLREMLFQKSPPRQQKQLTCKWITWVIQHVIIILSTVFIFKSLKHNHNIMLCSQTHDTW